MARRRRDLVPLSLFIRSALSSLCFVFVFVFVSFLDGNDSINRSVKEFLSLPAVVGSPRSTVPVLSNPSKAPPGSDQCSVKFRSLVLSPMRLKEPKPRSKSFPCVESGFTHGSALRAKVGIASVDFSALKLLRRGMIDGFAQAHLVSSSVGYSASIHNLRDPAFPSRSPPRRQNHLTAAVGEEKLGLPLLGLLIFGPCSCTLRPTLASTRPLISHRPRFFQKLKRTSPYVYLHLDMLSISRGLFSVHALGWLQGEVYGYHMAGKLSCEIGRIETDSVLENKVYVAYTVDLRVYYLYQTLIILQSPSTTLISSDMSNSLLERGICLWGSTPMKSFTFLTALLSSISEEVTVLTLMRSEVLKFSKSPYAVQAVTTLKLAADLVLRFNLERNPKPSNSFVDNLSNSCQFVYLSSFGKLVSLSLPFACSYAVAVYVCFRCCPIKLLYLVTNI